MLLTRRKHLLRSYLTDFQRSILSKRKRCRRFGTRVIRPILSIIFHGRIRVTCVINEKTVVTCSCNQRAECWYIVVLLSFIVIWLFLLITVYCYLLHYVMIQLFNKHLEYSYQRFENLCFPIDRLMFTIDEINRRLIQSVNKIVDLIDQ